MSNDVFAVTDELADRPISSRVSLVIPGRNCASTLERCLASVVPLLSVVGDGKKTANRG